MENKVFDRIEKKYLITKTQKRRILSEIKKHLKKDDYHKSEVYNLYFDTDNFDLINQSIDWTTFKHKLRARSYGGYDRVFLEIKTKLRGRDNNPGFKRRVMITRNDFDELVDKKASAVELAMRSIETKNDLQIAREVDYFISHFNLLPKIMVMYDRESYKGEDGLRITFDENLMYRDDDLSFNSEKHGKIYFKDNKNIIMELKSHGVIPLWLVSKMSKLKIYPQQFSKIGKSYEKIRKEQNV